MFHAMCLKTEFLVSLLVTMPPKSSSKQLKKDRALLSKMINERDTRFPPPFNSNPIFTRKFRYQCVNAEVKDQDYVTMASLQNLQYIPTSATAALGYFSAVRLKQVEIWANASVANTMNTISIDWLSNDGPNRQIAATGNTLEPAHLKVRPPKSCAAGRWYAGQLLAQNTPTSIVATTPYAFAIQSQQSGAICEITVDYTLFDTDSLNNPFALVCAGATAGNLTTNAYLDNTSVSLGNGTKNWSLLYLIEYAAGYVSAW
jgi:hypothetical protein